ncbi:MAG TPA: FAD-dependent oxidoreductase, partial [Thermoprotei archaeon]|nr:FAD-dependent oxidoreductase [Thermoprotei archaeon]
MMIAIIGSGIAGLTAAISLIKRGFDVVVYTPDVFKSNSYLAQAGIALPLANGDSPLNHVLDTLKSGKGLSNIETVWNVISKATEAYDFLTSLGLEFDYISKEGGHSTARVFSIRGETGKWITTRLIEVCKEYGIDIINKSVEGLAIGGRECYG